MGEVHFDSTAGFSDALQSIQMCYGLPEILCTSNCYWDPTFVIVGQFNNYESKA